MVERKAFDHLNRKIELIRGELREMNPAGPLRDDFIVYLNNWSARCTASEKIVVTSQTGLNLSDLHSRPEPDLMWLHAKRYRGRHPTAADLLLAIEVADSSLRSDKREKGELYAQAGIVEYWIIDANDQCVHVFQRPVGQQYMEQSSVYVGDTVSPLCLPQAALDLHDLFLGD